ncbi:MAG: YebG family protein [Colwellia sp.]|nr:YebG family protein [Colwellia sp.]
MAVESRFVVIRQGVEVATFMDKKAADEYDKMLDMADSLAEMFESTTLDLDEKTREELCIYLAKNRDDVLVALQAKKAKPATVVKKAQPKVVTEVNEDKKVEAKVAASDEVAAKLVTEVKKPKAARKAKANKTAA